MRNGLLCLSRKPLQSITVKTAYGEEIIVSINHIEGQQVSLCFDAPLDVEIMRTELLHQDEDIYVEGLE